MSVELMDGKENSQHLGVVGDRLWQKYMLVRDHHRSQNMSNGSIVCFVTAWAF